MNLNWILGFNRWRSSFWGMISALTLQQIAVAASSIYLVRFLAAIQNDQDWKIELIAYLALVIFPFFPGFISIYFSQTWIAESLDRVWQSSIKRFEGRVGSATDDKERSLFSTQVKELAQLTDETCRFVHGYFPSSLNFLLNIYVIAQILGQNFLVAFLLGICISGIQLKLASSFGSVLSVAKQRGQAAIDFHFSKGWQTITLKNKHEFESFIEELNIKKSTFVNHTQKASLFENGNALFFLTLSLLPTIFVIGEMLIDSSIQKKDIVALGALLPRIFQIFTVSSNLLSSSQSLFTIRSRWKDVLNRISSLANGEPLENRIQYSRISVVNLSSGQELGAAKFLQQFEHLPKGRWRVTGVNGSGKSSLLQLIKSESGDSCYYLPANYECFNADIEVLSTGQKKVRELQNLLSSASIYKLFLLDEWTANLDPESRKTGEHLIEALTQHGTVIEVLHT